ncbi:MAG: class I SAM-dependent methyltransferase [Acidobacteriota bacterium]
MSALDRLMENVHVYRLWQAPFAEQKFAPVVRHNDLRQVTAALDLGCGPGTNAHHFAGARYLGLDWNPAYVDHARRRYRGEFAVADICNEEVTGGRRFDFILANSIFHHVPDRDASRILAALADRLTPDGHVHIIDMVVPAAAGIARYLATHDRGEHPRSRERWEQMLCDAFEPVVIEPYHLTGFGIPLWHMVYFKGRRKS